MLRICAWHIRRRRTKTKTKTHFSLKSQEPNELTPYYCNVQRVTCKLCEQTKQRMQFDINKCWTQTHRNQPKRNRERTMKTYDCESSWLLLTANAMQMNNAQTVFMKYKYTCWSEEQKRVGAMTKRWQFENEILTNWTKKTSKMQWKWTKLRW